MISAIIQLAHSLNLQMIAEGVETEAQREWLSHAGWKWHKGSCLPDRFRQISSKNVIWRRKALITKVKKGLACASQLKIFNIFVSIMIQVHFCQVVWVLL